MAESFRHTAFFIGPNVREAVQSGRADFMPIFLSEIPALFKERLPELHPAKMDEVSLAIGRRSTAWRTCTRRPRASARALINVAHPKFREELEQHARAMKLL